MNDAQRKAKADHAENTAQAQADSLLKHYTAEKAVEIAEAWIVTNKELQHGAFSVETYTRAIEIIKERTADAAPASYEQALIEANKDAPADTLIRALYESGCTVVDCEDGEELETVQDCLEMWYSVDELTLDIEGDTVSSFVSLIHQDKHNKPSMEDISNYGTSLETIPAIKAALTEETYAPVYRI